MKVDFIKQDLFDTYLYNLIQRSLEEDIGAGDHTTLSTIPDNKRIRVKLIVKDEGIIAGVDLAHIILKTIDSDIKFDKFIEDGSSVKYGDIAFEAEGKAYTILTGERLLLNFMQRLSGISTRTAYLSDLIKDYNTKLLDTRKTTPGLRLLEKWAVKLGGGTNHRIGLYDMVLVKDNHIDSAGGVTNAVNFVHQYLNEKNLKLKVEVEIRTFEELYEIIRIKGVDRILLDNFSPDEMTKAIEIIDGKLITEASGGINDKNIVEYAKTGVDYISSGSLTYSVNALDLSLKVM